MFKKYGLRFYIKNIKKNIFANGSAALNGIAVPGFL